MPKTILSHFDTKKRKHEEDEELRERDVYPVDLDVSGIRENDDTEGGNLNSSYEEDMNHEYDDDEDEMRMEDVDMADDDETESFGEFSKMIRDASDAQLQLLLTGCLGRWTQRDFERTLTSFDDEFSAKVRNIWNCKKSSLSVVYICNSCGTVLQKGRQCCTDGHIAKFVRLGVSSQLSELINAYYDSILNIRQKLKRGEATKHNLAGPFFRPLWQTEPEGNVYLSGVLSVDGVCVPGNKKKVWPITMVVVDLKTSEMQESSNVLVEGIVECSENPSTTLWNSIYDLVCSDCHKLSIRVKNKTFTLHCVTVSADQPAKRGLLGMKSHHAAGSCFFCMSSGTFYKSKGSSRQERGFDETMKDSMNGLNGFNSVPSKYNNLFMPYETPVDVLHNFGEGIFEVICKELFIKDSSLVPKSDLFKCSHCDYMHELSNVVLPSEFANISNRRNATDKILFFRLTLCLNAIASDTLNTKARLVIIALSLLCNKMYTGGRASQIFDGEMTASASWFLMEASERYISCKAHEILYHLPHANMLFNNVAPLSTFCFESAYQYILLGYSSKITRNHSETVCSRVLLHNLLRREIANRAESSHSKKLKKFCSLAPGVFKPSSALKYRVDKLKTEDIVSTLDINCNYFGFLSMSLGSLKSEYCDSKTQNDIFFVENSGKMECYRFVVAFEVDGLKKVLAEPIRSTEERFLSLRTGVEELADTDLHYGLTVLKMMDSYEGITCGRLTGERSIIAASSIHSIACYTYSDDSIIALAINGIAVHN